MTSAEAQAAILKMAGAMRIHSASLLRDPVEKMKRAYVLGEIEVDQLEAGVEAALKAEEWGWTIPDTAQRETR